MTVAEISLDLIRELADLRDALRACVMFSGKPLKEIAHHLDIEVSHLSKMLNPGADPRHFPPQKIPQLMEVCGNEVPLLWLVNRLGYPDVRLLAQMQAEIERLHEELVRAKGEAGVVFNVFKNFELKR